MNYSSAARSRHQGLGLKMAQDGGGVKDSLARDPRRLAVAGGGRRTVRQGGLGRPGDHGPLRPDRSLREGRGCPRQRRVNSTGARVGTLGTATGRSASDESASKGRHGTRSGGALVDAYCNAAYHLKCRRYAFAPQYEDVAQGVSSRPPSRTLPGDSPKTFQRCRSTSPDEERYPP